LLGRVPIFKVRKPGPTLRLKKFLLWMAAKLVALFNLVILYKQVPTQEYHIASAARMLTEVYQAIWERIFGLDDFAVPIVDGQAGRFRIRLVVRNSIIGGKVLSPTPVGAWGLQDC
jgi:hypothetical protein